MLPLRRDLDCMHHQHCLELIYCCGYGLAIKKDIVLIQKMQLLRDTLSSLKENVSGVKT